MLRNKVSNIEVMPPFTPPAIYGQAVLSFIQVGESVEG
jgi:hypothetical protein